MSTINHILGAPQRIQDNLTSRQLFVILDDLIYRALLPLAHTTCSFREATAEVLATMLFSRRRLDNEQMSNLFRSLFEAPEAAIKSVQSAHIDRSFLFSYLYKVEKLGQDYTRALIEHARLDERPTPAVIQTLYKFQRMLGKDTRLEPAIKTSTYWSRLASDWKAQIIEKYVRLIFTRAKRTATTSSFTVDIKDVFSAGYITASRAVDRFASDKGVFTTYLARWLNSNVHVRHTNGVGLAFGSSTRYAPGTGFSVPIDDIQEISDDSKLEIDESSTMVERIALIAKDRDVRDSLVISGIVPAGAPKTRAKIRE